MIIIPIDAIFNIITLAEGAGHAAADAAAKRAELPQ